MKIDHSFKIAPGPCFLVLEGINGAGKSTLAALIAKHLEQKGVRLVTTREPGGTDLGLALRSLLLEPNYADRSPLSELFMFAADRSEHVAKAIRPTLARGDTVISDRYLYSTLAFQGYGRGLDLKTLEVVNEIAVDGITPSLVILLDLNPRDAEKRLSHRNSGSDVLEKEGLEFHDRVRNGFLALAENRPEPFLVLDASKSADVLADDVIKLF